jgi:predicted ABC-type ATPase
MDLVVFTGLQGSGKTTFYWSYYSDIHVLVGKDRLRNRRHRAAVQRRLIEEALRSGRSAERCGPHIVFCNVGCKPIITNAID